MDLIADSPWVQFTQKAPNRVYYGFPPFTYPSVRPCVIARVAQDSLTAHNIGIYLSRINRQGIALAELRPCKLDTSRMVYVTKLEARSSQDMVSCFLSYLVDVICFEATSPDTACTMVLNWTQKRAQSSPNGNLPVAAFKIYQPGATLGGGLESLRDALSAVLDPAQWFSKLVLLPVDTDGSQINALLLPEAVLARRRRARNGYHWTGYALKEVGHGMAQQLATVRNLRDINCINALETRRLPQPLLGQDLRLGALWSSWLSRKHDALSPRSGRLSILARCVGMDIATMYEGMRLLSPASPCGC